MNQKRVTPNAKCLNFSRSNTPSNLNSTVGNVRSSSHSKLLGCTSILVPGTSQAPRRCPSIKANLSDRRMVDFELECDFIYNEYLQALIKQEIIAKSVANHMQEISDQVAISKDKLHKSNVKYKKVNSEIARSETLEYIDEVLDQIQDNTDSFLTLVHGPELNSTLNTDSFLTLDDCPELNSTLGQLMAVMKWSSSNVAVKNVVPVTSEEEVEKLSVVLKKCGCLFAKMLSGRDLKGARDFATSVKKYIEIFEHITEKQASLTKSQDAETLKLLKSLSDMYAKRQNY